MSEGAQHLPDGICIQTVASQIHTDALVLLTRLVEGKLVQVVQPVEELLSTFDHYLYYYF